MTLCPKCSHENSDSAYFCTSCHQILIHRCPKCWHEQRQGAVCEKCGTIFALYWELAFERSVEEENRLWWEKLWGGIQAFLNILYLPFISVGSVCRSVATRLAAQTAAAWLARKSR